jgi:hypothetical protein
MNNMNLFRLVSIVCFWSGFFLTSALGVLFVFQPPWEISQNLFLRPSDTYVALVLAIVPFPISLLARYLSKT